VLCIIVASFALLAACRTSPPSTHTTDRSPESTPQSSLVHAPEKPPAQPTPPSQPAPPLAQPATPPAQPVPHAAEPVAAPAAQNPIVTIAELEDTRSDGEGLLEVLLVKGEPSTRVRAATALGRLPFPEHGSEVTNALCAALKDENQKLRCAAAFAIGERGDPAAASALLASLGDKDDNARARMIEAASRIDDESLHAAVLRALDDPSPLVRVEAALGPHRWPLKPPAPASTAASSAAAEDRASDNASAPRALDDRAIDGALIEVARDRGAIDPDKEPDPAALAARKPAVFSLMRRKCESARGAFAERVGDTDDPESRIFAIQGLGNITADPATNVALYKALLDPDWRVVCEAAAALGKHPDCDAVQPLIATVGNASPHARRVVYEALGNFRACKDAIRKVLESARLDPSANVRAAALEAEAKLYGDESAPRVESAIASNDPVLRAGAASAAAYLSSKLAVAMLIQLSKDSNRRVADIATHGLENHPTEEARARLHELLAGPDNGLRLAAIEALRKEKRAEDLPLLARCFETSKGEISSEIAFGVLESAAAIGGEQGLELVERGLAHDDPYVRKKAREWIAKSYPAAAVPAIRAPERKPARVPVAGRDFMYDENPRVEVRTSKGSMVFELLPDEAPVHVVSFLELVNAHHYDKFSFHRVVPDFVIQGGDTRGDGNGGTSWRGDALRAEFTPRKFLRGSLGMPRNEDPDSGGSQIFVTHRWTPHLDGRYTLFGTLVSGSEVLDAIEVGDTIEEVKLLAVHKR
jgi:cyclophilin family peptidyl-prolyl cis-trans isomerase/HEAT repeat protein